MLRSSSNFSRNVDWNLLKTFHEIVEARGLRQVTDNVAIEKLVDEAIKSRPVGGGS